MNGRVKGKRGTTDVVITSLYSRSVNILGSVADGNLPPPPALSLLKKKGEDKKHPFPGTFRNSLTLGLSLPPHCFCRKYRRDKTGVGILEKPSSELPITYCKGGGSTNNSSIRKLNNHLANTGSTYTTFDTVKSESHEENAENINFYPSQNVTGSKLGNWDLRRGSGEDEGLSALRCCKIHPLFSPGKLISVE